MLSHICLNTIIRHFQHFPSLPKNSQGFVHNVLYRTKCFKVCQTKHYVTLQLDPFSPGKRCHGNFSARRGSRTGEAAAVNASTHLPRLQLGKGAVPESGAALLRLFRVRVLLSCCCCGALVNATPQQTARSSWRTAYFCEWSPAVNWFSTLRYTITID